MGKDNAAHPAVPG